MTHPEIFEIIARIRHHGMIAGLISNGYYFQVDKINKLNEAGLDYLQISIDNVNPDEVSKKSLKVLDAKLVNLRDHAKFKININSVVGGVSFSMMLRGGGFAPLQHNRYAKAKKFLDTHNF